MSIFENRKSTFVLALKGIVDNANNITWREYVSKNSGASHECTPFDAEYHENTEILRYSEFLIGQGYSVEVAIEYSEMAHILHIVGWEEEKKPEWPSYISPTCTLTWHPTKANSE